MTYRGIAIWPPVWTKTEPDGSVRTLRGEVGTLEYVFANEQVSNKCFLVIYHESQRYVGALIFSNRAWCEQITRLLRMQLGKPISAIGDLNVDDML